MTSSPPHGVSRQWAVVVRYGMRQALACQADFWRQLGSPALLNNNSRELVPIINRSGCKWTAKPRWRCPYCPKFEPMIRSLWFCYPQPLSQSCQDQRPSCPVTTLYNKASLRSRRRSLRSRQPRSCSICVTLDVVLWSPLTNLSAKSSTLLIFVWAVGELERWISGYSIPNPSVRYPAMGADHPLPPECCWLYFSVHYTFYLVYIHQMNRVNSRNGSAMMKAS